MTLTTVNDRGLTTPIDLLDNEKIGFGTGDDLEIYHNGNHSFLINSTGDFVFQGDSIDFWDAAGSKALMKREDV